MKLNLKSPAQLDRAGDLLRRAFFAPCHAWPPPDRGPLAASVQAIPYRLGYA